MGAFSRLIASTLSEAFGSTATKVDDTVEALGDVSVKTKVEDIPVKAFEEKALAEAANQNEMSREILVEMPIDDFLNVAKKEVSQTKLKGTRALVEDGKPFNTIPSLSFSNKGDGTGQVVGHEGRHRAMALKERGETTIPVKIISDASNTGPSIRWGIQNDPTHRDYVELLPTKLIEEDGKSIISMPDIIANIRNTQGVDIAKETGLMARPSK